MNIQERQKQIIQDFDFLEDWEDKYQYLIDLGKELPALSEEKKGEENLIKGCQSQVWLCAENRENKIFFSADSNGILPKGIIAMLISVYNGQEAEAILQDDFKFLEKIQLQEFLSPSRANGLASMVKQMKIYALALSKI